MSLVEICRTLVHKVIQLQRDLWGRLTQAAGVRSQGKKDRAGKGRGPATPSHLVLLEGTASPKLRGAGLGMSPGGCMEPGLGWIPNRTGGRQ